jgi:hypothetical protein
MRFPRQRRGCAKAIAWAAAALLWVLDVGPPPTASAAGLCLPQPIAAGLARDAAPRSNASVIRTYLDGSGSMAGYVAGATSDVRPLGDLIEITTQMAAARDTQAQFFAFGSKIALVPGGPAGAARYATITPYTCRGCDNQESHIDAVLRQIAGGDRSGLNVVVSDFWLDNKSFVGSPQVALGVPLAQILQQGRTVGVLGLRAPFKGKIYDFPSGGPPYADASERALLVLLIGSASDVAAAYSALTQSNSPAFRPGVMRYSVFSTSIGHVWVNARAMTPVGGGVSHSAAIPPERLPGLQQFVMHRGTAQAQHGRIEGLFDAGAGVRDNAVWSGPLSASTRVWRLRDQGALQACPAAVWGEIGPLRSAWVAAGGSGAKLTVSPQTAAGLLPGGVYFVGGFLGVKRLQTPNPADSWMRDWSFGAAQEQDLRARRPRFFPTLNLADLAASMEGALDRAAPNGATTAAVGFVISVDG